MIGLELGADDYVTKPFGMRELVARIRAVLRRMSAVPPETRVLRLLDIVVNRGQRRVDVRGQPVKLTPSEFELLSTVMEAAGHVFSGRSFSARSRERTFMASSERSTVHVRNLRAKIEEGAKTPRYIETVSESATGSSSRTEIPEASVRSLTAKPFLAFLAVLSHKGGLGIVLVRRATQQEFQRFMAEDALPDFVALSVDHDHLRATNG